MIKYICALPILFSSFAFSAVNNNDMGLYRDNSYNILALAGEYTCSVQSVPDNLNDSDKFNNVQIGTAKLEVTPYSGDNSAMININFDTGVNITSPKLQVTMKGSDLTAYHYEAKDFIFVYGIREDIGIMLVVQNKRKGEEIAVSLANCKYDKK